jgi:hypothetical protein
MKKLFFFIFAIILNTYAIQAQTLIATSNHPDATANHNQRKIVRDTADNMFVVFQDIELEDTVIKGVYLIQNLGLWNEPFVICQGKNPTLAISVDCKIYLIYETNGSISSIAYKSSYTFTEWTEPFILSDPDILCSSPVADIDSSGTVNVLWVNKINNERDLGYARIKNDIAQSFEFNDFSTLGDIAVANHLQYFNNKLYFTMDQSVSGMGNLTEIYCSNDNMNSYEAVDFVNGSKPTLTYNTPYYDYSDWDAYPVVMFQVENGDLYQHQTDDEPDLSDGVLMQSGPIEYFCIDDIAPPLGYAFLFVKNSNLYQAFSFDNNAWFQNGKSDIPIIDTIEGPITNPSIAYKQYRFNTVDYIWTKQNGELYEIYYKHNCKYFDFSNNPDVNPALKGVMASPNPFTDNVLIDFTTIKTANITNITIFDSKGDLIYKTSTDQNCILWNASDNSGNLVKSGYYIILTENNGNKVAGRILKL